MVHIEKNITIFLQILSDFGVFTWIRKKVTSPVIINIDNQSLTIQENQAEPLLHSARASMIVTLLWNIKIVKISTMKITRMRKTIKSIISLKLRFLIQKFRVINKWARKSTIISLAKNDITFSRGFKFLYEK